MDIKTTPVDTCTTMINDSCPYYLYHYLNPVSTIKSAQLTYYRHLLTFFVNPCTHTLEPVFEPEFYKTLKSHKEGHHPLNLVSLPVLVQHNPVVVYRLLRRRDEYYSGTWNKRKRIFSVPTRINREDSYLNLKHYH